MLNNVGEDPAHDVLALVEVGDYEARGLEAVVGLGDRSYGSGELGGRDVDRSRNSRHLLHQHDGVTVGLPPQQLAVDASCVSHLVAPQPSLRDSRTQLGGYPVSGG